VGSTPRKGKHGNAEEKNQKPALTDLLEEKEKTRRRKGAETRRKEGQRWQNERSTT